MKYTPLFSESSDDRFYLNSNTLNYNDFLFALYAIVKNKEGGMRTLSQNTGLSKESLYKALKPDSRPRFETIFKIIESLGFILKIEENNSINSPKSPKYVREFSLLYSYPKYVLQWHPLKNKNITPNDVVPESKKKFWWQCTKINSHEWKESCNSRINKGTSDCPHCIK